MFGNCDKDFRSKKHKRLTIIDSYFGNPTNSSVKIKIKENNFGLEEEIKFEERKSGR